VSVNYANYKRAYMGQGSSNSVRTTSYNFKVVVEADPYDDGRPAYHAFCPALKQYGAATWGTTEAEALKNIEEVVHAVIDELIEDGIPIPDGPRDEVEVFFEPRVSVTV